MIRIALKMLLGDTTKYLGLVFGVFFSCLLITLLMSMFAGMLTRTHALIDDTRAADIWVMDSAVEYVEETMPLPEMAVQRVRGVEGVAWAVPVYIGSLRARLDDGRFRSVQVIGLDDASLAGLPDRFLSGAPGDLRLADAVVIDSVSAQTVFRRPNPLTGQIEPMRVGSELLLNDRRAIVVGVVEVSPRFMPKPTIYTTFSRAMGYAPPERKMVSFVLARAAAGLSPELVAARITDRTGLRARSHGQFSDDTLDYYIHNTDMISHVGLMVVLGGVVGTAVVSLLLFMFTRENARYYAALKAMGTPDATILKMLVAQGLACVIQGMALGVGGACLLGTLGKNAGIPFQLTGFTLAVSTAAMLLIMVVSITLSIRPLLRLEPAVVFRT